MSRTAQFCLRAISFCAILLVLTLPAQGRIGLVIGEPYGSFGTMLPVGHAAIYLDHICAASPTQLRRCNRGEAGVVLARYHDLRTRGLDWMAIPAFTFFYGVDSPAQMPAYVTPRLEAELRESYRQDHLLEIVPDRMDRHGKLHPPRDGDWKEGIGAAFDRRLLIYSVDTTAEQDVKLLAMLNGDANQRRYSLGRANCADFAAGLLSVVVPGVLHRNILADFDMTTPKNLARQLDAYGRSHPERGLRVYEVPQLPGSLRRSRPLRGAAETFVKTKRYLAVLIVLQPEAVFADWILYETEGKWTPGRDATEISPASWPSLTSPAAVRVSDSSIASSMADTLGTFSDASTLRAK